jgi:hypothetical protein
MNDIRRRALKLGLVCLVLLAAPTTYLWFVDYRGAAFAPGMTGVFVAFMTIPFLRLIRCAEEAWTGRLSVGYAPWQRREHRE